MSTSFLISDTHFQHSNILNFTRTDGSKLRSFSSADEMDNVMIKNWNSVVGPKDKVYHLGDVSFGKDLNIFYQLNGKKILIRGNHDKFDLSEYVKHFEDIRGVDVREKLVFSHIPLHKDSLYKNKLHVHGHLHYRAVMKNANEEDEQYFNVGVERINYTPISFDQVFNIMKQRFS